MEAKLMQRVRGHADTISALLLVSAVLAISSCGGGGGGGGGASQASRASAAVAVAISPASATVPAGGTQQFSATVTGTSNQAVSWSVQEGSAGGTVTGDGLYTAPQASGTFHVVAVSQADSTKSATATVTVTSASIAIVPKEVTVDQGAAYQFFANVTGTGNTAVQWSVVEGPAGGTVTSEGVYTAPEKAGTYHLTVTGQADPSKTDTATITVPSVAVEIRPADWVLGPEGVFTFSAIVSGTVVNQTVTWAVAEGAAGGTIDNAGTYIAPVTPETYHVVAAWESDPGVTATASIAVVSSGFKPTGSMQDARTGHVAARLIDGRVLVAGGVATTSCDPFFGCDGIFLSSAELFNPSTGTFAPTGGLVTARVGATATLLQNGQVLVTGGGGDTLFPVSSLASAELYDPATGVFTPTGSMNVPRAEHTATLLQDGRVLITGGDQPDVPPLSSAELYDPATGTFSLTGSMAAGRQGHTATLLPDGRVLIVGGWSSDGNGGEYTASAELYDPVTGMFEPTGSMTAGATGHSATLLTGGKVLIAGKYPPLPPSAELYDPATGTFSATGELLKPRFSHRAAILPNGKVLIAGGEEPGEIPTASAELFDPQTGTFAFTGSMMIPRVGHTATPLLDGGILVVGGSAGEGELSSAEIYR